MARVFLVVVICAMLVGCGGKSQEVAKNTIASAEEAYDKAIELMDAGDTAGALPHLDAAIAEDGLNVDLYTQAVLYRAQCYAAAGELEKAEADLQEAEMGAYDDALFHLSRGIVFAAQGKKAEAAKEYSSARKYDPDIKIPK